MKIMLVEPDVILAGNYRVALEHAGHTLYWAATAEDAVVIADNEQLDIIILEIQMPNHNGVEFLHEFRSYAEWQHIPIIILSMIPKTRIEISPEVLDLFGVKKYLYKPTTKLDKLVDTVKRLDISYQKL